MSYFGIIITLFGAFILYKPEIIAYIVGILFIIIGINMIFIKLLLKKKTESGKDYVAFGKYKIYKD